MVERKEALNHVEEEGKNHREFSTDNAAVGDGYFNGVQ
jgi:hypothetical protein